MQISFPPVRADLFSVFILLGAVQGFFLCYFFLLNSRGERKNNLYLGIVLLGMGFIMTDVWLGYTNYMFQMLWFVDSTEPFNLLLAPMIYLYIKTGITRQFDKRDLTHFIPFGLYFIYMCVLIYPQSMAFKYNSNIGSYHPQLNEIPAYVYGRRWMFFLKWHINTIMMASMLYYIILVFIFLQKAYIRQGLSFFTSEHTQLSWYRKLSLKLLLIAMIILVTRLTFLHDFGDHIVATFISLIVYSISFSVFSKSEFFLGKEKAVEKKYKKSSLSLEMQDNSIKKLELIMSNEKLYTDSNISLPLLAKKIGISRHHLSQILNDKLEQSFSDFLAAHRIAEAQRLLMSKENSYIKIDEIAQMVGYNSKSAFNTTFRKVTGVTPSEFRKHAVK